jgi:hypothetical protein
MSVSAPATPNMFDRYNLEIDNKNIVPRDDTSNTLKIWQRLCASFACLEVHERPRVSNETKFADCLKAYERFAVLMCNNAALKQLMPSDFTPELLCRDARNCITPLTGII